MPQVPSSRAPLAPSDRAELLARTHRLLASGVPLSLLLDLAEPRGPHSAELFAAEEPDLAWLAQHR